jgi:hypothetical protein
MQTITLIDTMNGKRDGKTMACTSPELQIGSNYDPTATA